MTHPYPHTMRYPYDLDAPTLQHAVYTPSSDATIVTAPHRPVTLVARPAMATYNPQRLVMVCALTLGAALSFAMGQHIGHLPTLAASAITSTERGVNTESQSFSLSGSLGASMSAPVTTHTIAHPKPTASGGTHATKGHHKPANTQKNLRELSPKLPPTKKHTDKKSSDD